ncbi:MAG TPA: DUF2835 family protein [Gammaproteobacteria bacterium]|nr:DUF2835 family protein [Gammaproteobacteria bacterium]
MAISEVRFHLHIPADVYLSYYQGQARHVLVATDEGLKVQFPARLLRPYVTREGVTGEFRLRYDEHHKLVGLDKLSD